MVGQHKLISQINSYTAETLPKTIMLIGEQGCGKHLVTSYISKKFNLATVELSTEVSVEDLRDYSLSPIPTMYIIDITKFTEKQQNQFLKFLEEPAQSVYICIHARSIVGVLPTIINRCTKLFFEAYSTTELIEVCPAAAQNPLLCRICTTPGQIISEVNQNGGAKRAQELYDLCSNLVLKINKANWANTLKIATMINYKESFDKFDFSLFLNTLELAASDIFIDQNNQTSFYIYETVVKAKAKSLNLPIAKETFIFNLLTTIWKETR